MIFIRGMAHEDRDLYLSRLLEFKDKEQVKIIAGVRRSGKSTLLAVLKQHLQESGVPGESILHLNYESYIHSRREF